MRASRRSSLPILVALVPYVLAMPNVTWIRPVEGDVYEPGQAIMGQWATTRTLYSPSFRLCSSELHKRGKKEDKYKHEDKNEDEDKGDHEEKEGGDEDGGDRDHEDKDEAHDKWTGDEEEDENCGSEVWPMVHHTNGSYQIILAAPNVTSPSKFYLELHDDEGTTAASPPFSLRPASLAASKPSDPLQKNSIPASSGESPQAPPSVPPPPVSQSSPSPASPLPSPLPSPSHTRPADTSSPSPSPSPNIAKDSVPQPDADPNTSSSNTLSPSPSTPSPATTPNDRNQTEPFPSLMQTHQPTPTAAYAVPLSLVGVVTLSAIILCVHHRRRLRDERNAESEKALTAGDDDLGKGGIERHPTRIWRTAFGNLGRELERGIGTIREYSHGWGRRGMYLETEGRESRVSTPSASRRSSIMRLRDEREKKDDIYTQVYIPSLYSHHHHRQQQRYQQSRHQPRQRTRDPYPYYESREGKTSRGPRTKMDPAKQFREVTDPAFTKFSNTSSIGTESLHASPPPPAARPKNGYDDIQDEVLSHYMQPSPSASLIPEPTPPRPVHSRRSTRTGSYDGTVNRNDNGPYLDVYAEVARRLPGGPR